MSAVGMVEIGGVGMKLGVIQKQALQDERDTRALELVRDAFDLLEQASRQTRHFYAVEHIGKAMTAARHAAADLERSIE